MSEPGKPDVARGWLAVEKLLSEDEAERIEKLSGDELRAELRAEGVDPARIPSGDELRRRVLARAAREAKTGEQPPPSGVVAQAVDAVEEPAAPVVPIRRSSRLGWVLAVAAAILLIFAAVKRPQIVAFFRGEHGVIGPLPPPTPREMAEELRHNAVGRCEQSEFVACGDLLDHAAQLDPAGESEESVQKLRADIAKANAPQQKKDKPDKPPP